MLIIILFMINSVFVGVDWWWLLTDLRRRSRLLLQSGNLHGCCPCWRCNRHLRGLRRLPKNQIASTWRSRLNQSYVRQGDFADSAPTEYCTTFHFRPPVRPRAWHFTFLQCIKAYMPHESSEDPWIFIWSKRKLSWLAFKTSQIRPEQIRPD